MTRIAAVEALDLRTYNPEPEWDWPIFPPSVAAFAGMPERRTVTVWFKVSKKEMRETSEFIRRMVRLYRDWPNRRHWWHRFLIRLGW